MELIETSAVDESDPMWEALKGASQKSDMRFKMSAALVHRGRILAVACNLSKTHSRFGSNGDYKTLHAEGNLLWVCEKLGIDPSGMCMVVYRKNFLNAKPCSDCQRHIEKAGIKKVIYTNRENNSIVV